MDFGRFGEVDALGGRAVGGCLLVDACLVRLVLVAGAIRWMCGWLQVSHFPPNLVWYGYFG